MIVILRNTWFQPVLKVIIVATMVPVIAYLLQLSITSGRLYDILAPWLSTQPSHTLESALFESRNIKKVDLIAVGEPSFIANIKTELPACLRVLFLPMREFRFSDLQFAIKQTENIKRKFTIIQNFPHFWTDARPLGPKQDVKLWKSYKKKRKFANLLKHSRVFFDVVASAAGGSNKTGKHARRQTSFYNISYQFPGKVQAKSYRQLKKSLRGIGVESIYWYIDLGNIPGNATNTLREKIKDSFAADVLHETLGNLQSIEKFPQLEQTLNGYCPN